MVGRPFLAQTFLEFLENFESKVKHKIAFIYWVDQQSGHMLENRPGWQMKIREVYAVNKLAPEMSASQRYSIWTYKPLIFET